MAEAKMVIVFKSGAVHSVTCSENEANAIADDFYNEAGNNPDVTKVNLNGDLYESTPGGTIRARVADISAILVERP